jgi:hypothetical protein
MEPNDNDDVSEKVIVQDVYDEAEAEPQRPPEPELVAIDFITMGMFIIGKHEHSATAHAAC